MPEVQARGLIEMMSHAHPSSRLEACLLPQSWKRSTLKHLAIDDIVVFPTKEAKVVLLDEADNVVSCGRYGLLRDLPSILIEEGRDDTWSHIDSKKYRSLKVSLGTISSPAPERGEILSLEREGGCEAILYRERRLLACADLVQLDGHLALHIREVV